MPDPITAAWKPGAHTSHEDIEQYAYSAFNRGSVQYGRYGPRGHNPMMEYLGNQTVGLEGRFKPKSHVFAFDLETTGLSKDADVIQFYSRIYDQNLNSVDEGFEVLGQVSPSTTWDNKAKALAQQSGLTDDVLMSNGVPRAELGTKILQHVEAAHAKYGKLQVLGSNVRFDMDRLGSLIGEENVGKYFDQDLLDTMSLSAFESGRRGSGYTSHSLEAVTERLGIANLKAHNAAHDVPAAVESYKLLLSGIDQPASSPVIKMMPKVMPSAETIQGIKSRNWKIAAAVVGVGIVGMASRGGPEPQEVQGIRKPYGPHDTIHGINTSGHLTPFGSGRNVFKQFMNEVNLGGTPWIHASSLGFKSQEEINQQYMADAEKDPESRGITSSGTYIHHLYQDFLTRSGQALAVEVEVTDPRNKVQGSIDVLLKGNIPLEIKTVNSMYDLRKLVAPKETAAAQGNAYAVMTGAPYSLVMYTTREDQSQYKTFKVPVDFERYRADIARIRLGLSRMPGPPIGVNSLNVNLKQIGAFFNQPEAGIDLIFGLGGDRARAPTYYAPDPPQGIRQAYPTNPNQFEAMNSHPQASFPGGRRQSFGQLPRMKDPINHGYRNQRRHAVGFRARQAHSWHPIGSRAARSSSNA